MKNHTKRGFTLTELAIVMTIIGAVLSAIWTASAVVSENRKATRAVAQILEIETNVKDMYAMKPTFGTGVAGTDISANILIPNNAIPADLVQAGAAVSPWGAVAVWAVPPGAATKDVFRISYYGVTPSICTKIASGIITNSGTKDANPMQLITQSGLTTVDLTTTAVDSTSIAANYCVKDATLATSSVEFDFRLVR